MAFKLKVGKIIETEVSVELKDGDQYRAHKIGLVLKRLDTAQFELLMQRARDGDLDDRALLAEMVSDWRQHLVLDENDQPAGYSLEAMDCMCSVLGMRRLLAEKAINAQLDGMRAAAPDKQGN